MSTEVSRAHTDDPPSALARGTRLGEFELLRVLGIGGFGIVYLAFDHALEREVAVKEYMPATLVGRTQTLHVTLRSQSDAETFALGLKSFVNEARLLARFDHPSLLKVLRFWEANGTAYMAMPVLRGQTLKELRLTHKQPPDEAWMRGLLEPLLGAIGRLHSEGVYHRDIAPDNIQIEADGRPVLLDFGAARRVISDKSQNLTAILKPAYAPIEQYAEVGSVRQGPWTDLYALGATLYFLLVGRPPSPATARSVHDDVAPLSGQAFAGCSEGFLHIIDWMLAPRPSDRPQNVNAVLDALHGRGAPPRRRVASEPVPSQWDQTIMVPAPLKAVAALPAVPASTHKTPLPVPPVDVDFEDEMETVLVPPRSGAVRGQ
ncbi:MAG: serine/threonine protein kinase, partial [Chitinophagaceae bacterium]|nr:serine/threonine protein kinase [Rubrivivax sp.]